MDVDGGGEDPGGAFGAEHVHHPGRPDLEMGGLGGQVDGEQADVLAVGRAEARVGAGDELGLARWGLVLEGDGERTLAIPAGPIRR